MLKKTDKYIALSAVCMLTLSACSSDDALSVADNEGKTPIELTVGITGESPSVTRAATRSVVTVDKDANKALAFEKGTSLYMVMKGVDKDYANKMKYTRTIGYAQEKAKTASNADDPNNTIVKFADSYIRYWEDSYSRDTELSIYSACVPGYYLDGTVYSGVTANGTQDVTTPWTIGGSSTYTNSWANWAGSNETTIAWPLRSKSVATQDADFISNQDLCFSNNISKYTISSTETDNRIKFDDDNKKFTSGRMVFYHALTWVTFKIKHGAGFTGDDTDFKFTNSTTENIVLEGFNTSGTFDIVTGEFLTDPAIGTEKVNKLAQASEDGFDYVYNGIILPGTDLNSTSGNVHFTIDGNLYTIPMSKLAEALSGKTTDKTEVSALDDGKMRAGVHYIFTMTVGKTKMEKFSAAVAPWETVSADEMTPTNARIQVSLLQNGTKLTGNAAFDLYRSIYTHGSIDDSYADYTWTTGYVKTDNSINENKAILTENTTNPGIYTANEADNSGKAWYWPNNKTFYHFRTVMPKDHAVSVDNNGTTDNATDDIDYITLNPATYTETDMPSTTDVCWGAPFNYIDVANGARLTYSLTSGFDNTGTTHQISKGIGPTTDEIKMQLFHMMSDVIINLTTTTGDDKVDLTNASMVLSNIYPSGKVLMGNGLVTPTGSLTTYNNTVSSSNQNPWKSAFVPQALNTSGSKVVLTITTTDHNQYIVDLCDVVATTVSNTLIKNPYTKDSNDKYKIYRWYPNYQYTYTFKLTKAGIAQITATLADWETVTAEEEVQIK